MNITKIKSNKGDFNMTYPIDENMFVDICMKELGDHDEWDEMVAHAVAVTLNWAYYKGLIDNKQNN